MNQPVPKEPPCYVSVAACLVPVGLSNRSFQPVPEVAIGARYHIRYSRPRLFQSRFLSTIQDKARFSTGGLFLFLVVKKHR